MQKEAGAAQVRREEPERHTLNHTHKPGDTKAVKIKETVLMCQLGPSGAVELWTLSYFSVSSQFPELS